MSKVNMSLYSERLPRVITRHLIEHCLMQTLSDEAGLIATLKDISWEEIKEIEIEFLSKL